MKKRIRNVMCAVVMGCLLLGLLPNHAMAAEVQARQIFDAYRAVLLECQSKGVSSPYGAATDKQISYVLYDIDKDGTPELIVKVGYSKYSIYAFQGGKAILCGDMTSSYQDCLYEYDGNGLLVHDGGFGTYHSEYVYLYTLSGNVFAWKEDIFGDVFLDTTITDYLAKQVRIVGFCVADDYSLLEKKFGIQTENIVERVPAMENPYKIYERMLPQFYSYTLYDINQDGVKELIIGDGSSMAMHFFGIKNQSLIEYKDDGEVNDIWGLYEKDNTLYVLRSSLAGVEEPYVFSDIALLRLGERNGSITTEYLYRGEYRRNMDAEPNPFDISEIANSLKGAREVEIKATTDHSLLENNKQIRVFLNGKEMNLSQPPVMVQGNTMVPMRAIFEALGAEVSYEAQSKKITAEKDGTQVLLWVGQRAASVDGALRQLPTAVVNQNGSAMVPLRFVSEAFGAEVAWDAGSKTITIRL